MLSLWCRSEFVLSVRLKEDKANSLFFPGCSCLRLNLAGLTHLESGQSRERGRGRLGVRAERGEPFQGHNSRKKTHSDRAFVILPPAEWLYFMQCALRYKVIYWCIIDWLLRENIVISFSWNSWDFSHCGTNNYQPFLHSVLWWAKYKTWNLHGDHWQSKSQVQFLNLLWTIVWLIFKSYKNNRHQYPCSSFLCVFTEQRIN